MSYFERALLAGVLIGAVCGLTGALVIARRRTFFTQALTHATFPGAVSAVMLGIPVPLGAAGAGALLVLAMNALGRVTRQGRQVATGVVLTGGFASGAILQSLSPALAVDPEALLVGSILTVSWTDIAVAAAVLLAVVVAYLGWGPRLLFSTVDPVGYRAAGFREGPTDALALALITATVVAALPAAGAILTIALIAAPAAAARLIARSALGAVLLAPAFGITSAIVGVLASRWLAVSAGAAISLTASVLFALALLATRPQALRWRRRAARMRAAEVE